MKKLLFSFCLFILFTLGANAQNDTVFVDQNDTTYLVMPGGYYIIDTVDVVKYRSIFATGNNTGCGGGIRMNTFNLPNNNFYVFWSLDIKNGAMVGSYFYGHGSTPLDTINVDSTTQTIQYTDTFLIVSDTLKSFWNCNASGNANVESKSYYQHIQTHIRIAPISTGLTDNTNKNKLVLYPNPAQSVITLSGSRSLIGRVIEVYDIGGRMVKSERLNKEQLTISELEKGVYFLSIPHLNKRIKFLKR